MASTKKKAASGKESTPCWKGYVRVPGKKPETKGSCKKKGR